MRKFPKDYLEEEEYTQAEMDEMEASENFTMQKFYEVMEEDRRKWWAEKRKWFYFGCIVFGLAVILYTR